MRVLDTLARSPYVDERGAVEDGVVVLHQLAIVVGQRVPDSPLVTRLDDLPDQEPGTLICGVVAAWAVPVTAAQVRNTDRACRCPVLLGGRSSADSRSRRWCRGSPGSCEVFLGLAGLVAGEYPYLPFSRSVTSSRTAPGVSAAMSSWVTHHWWVGPDAPGLRLITMSILVPSITMSSPPGSVRAPGSRRLQAACPALACGWSLGRTPASTRA